MQRRQPIIVGVGGTLRVGSTSERALALALAAAAQMGASTEIFSGPAISLPAYDPSDRQRGPEAKALVAALRRADGVIFDHGPCMACDAAVTARSTSRAQPCGIRAQASPR